MCQRTQPLFLPVSVQTSGEVQNQNLDYTQIKAEDRFLLCIDYVLYQQLRKGEAWGGLFFTLSLTVTAAAPQGALSPPGDEPGVIHNTATLSTSNL